MATTIDFLQLVDLCVTTTVVSSTIGEDTKEIRISNTIGEHGKLLTYIEVLRNDYIIKSTKDMNTAVELYNTL